MVFSSRDSKSNVLPSTQLQPWDSGRMDATLDDQKRPSYRQQHVNGLLPTRLRPSSRNPKKGCEFHILFVGCIFFERFWTRPRRDTTGGHPSRAGYRRARSALSRSERVRATISVFTLTVLRRLINATSANSIKSKQGIVTQVGCTTQERLSILRSLVSGGSCATAV